MPGRPACGGGRATCRGPRSGSAGPRPGTRRCRTPGRRPSGPRIASGVFGRERAVLGLVVAERLQGAVDGRHGQLGPGVERAGALAGVPGPHEVELARGDHPLDEPGRLGLDAGLVLGCRIPSPSACRPARPGRPLPWPSASPTPRRRGSRRRARPSSVAGFDLDLGVCLGRRPPGRPPARPRSPPRPPPRSPTRWP